MYDITAQVCQDMGGAAGLPQATLNLIRCFASLSVQLERLDAAIARGEAINHMHYVKLSSTLVRISARLSLRRATHVDRAVAALARRKRAKPSLADVAVPSPFGNIDPEGSIEPEPSRWPAKR
jgi:hypothetical protein